MFSMLVFMASSLNDSFSYSNDEGKTLLMSNNIINYLLESGGYPLNWNINNVKEIGLCDSSYIINAQKLETFIFLLNNNYSYTKDLMSLENKDFYISLEYMNGSEILEFKLNKSVENAMISKRKVMYEGFPAILKVGVLI